uniref:Ribonuclease P protein subunit p40 n=1 Tax=Lygus hesperus TaxID=30085 RepID=A0A0A9VVU6_LYGHE
MENPNVSKFKPHPVRVKFCEARMDCPVIRDTIRSHPFNHSVWLLFADTLAVPPDIREVLNVDTTYYKVVNLPLFRLVEKNFIEAFVKTGETTCLTIGTHLDCEHVFAVTPDGHLILSITRTQFLDLGIEQSPAVTIIKQKTDNKFHIRINLKENCFVPGKKNYERILSRLQLSNLKATFVCCWEPLDENTCPSSLALYFHKICRVGVSECNLQFDYRVDYNVSVPQSSTPHAEVFEWLALQSLGFNQDCGKAELEYLSSFTGPEYSKKVGPCCVLSWTGLITSSKLLTLFDRIKKYADSRSTIPIIGMQVIGFEDAPVSWRSDVHHYLTNGDNNHALAIFGNRKVLHCINYVAPYS